ncbi:MAG: leucine-rich repeat protein [Clostridia bacterium]|nr:leucine-rich repeat protein [Clostridia bacterium]
MKDNKYLHSKIVKDPEIAPLKSERFNTSCDNDDYIFISYSHHDKKVVMADLKRLYASNANYWFDAEIKYERNSGTWRQIVQQRIENDSKCRGVVFYVSSHSIVSDAVHFECECYIRRNQKEKESSQGGFFPYYVILVDGDNIFDVQQKSDMSLMTSQRMIMIHTLFGSDVIFEKASNSIQLPEVFDFFVKNGCLKNNWLDQSENNVIVSSNYLIIGDSLVSYFDADGKEFHIEDEHTKILKIIQQNAVSGPNIERIVVPEGVEVINDFAFYACKRLKCIHLPKTLKKISFYALSNASYREITVDDDNLYFTTDADGSLYSKDENGEKTSLIAHPNHSVVKELKIAEGVKSINDFVLMDSKYLEKIQIPSSVRYIGYCSLNNCMSLKEIYLSDSVSYISPHCFGDNMPPDLSVYFTGSISHFKSKNVNSVDTFETMFNRCKVYIDEGNGIYTTLK